MECCICGNELINIGNNPYPLCSIDDFDSRCCDNCNEQFVIPMRIFQIPKNMKYQVGDSLALLFKEEQKEEIYNRLIEARPPIKGQITKIQGNKIFGSWGNYLINADTDCFVIISEED